MENVERRKALGRAVRQARERQGLSQRKLAYMLGYTSHSYVNEIENGRTSVGFDVLCDIADALGTEVRYFFIDF